MDLHLLKRGSLTHSSDASSASEAGARYQQDAASVGSHGNASGQSYELIKSTQVILNDFALIDNANNLVFWCHF